MKNIIREAIDELVLAIHQQDYSEFILIVLVMPFILPIAAIELCIWMLRGWWRK